MKIKDALRILIVEDEDSISREVQEKLEGLGYLVAGVVTLGEEALQEAGRVRPDLVFMDLNLPGNVDAIEVVHRIRTGLHIPVVCLAHSADDVALRQLKIKTSCVSIMKPFDEKDLQVKIEAALAQHEVDQRLNGAVCWPETILENIREAVMIADAGGRVTFINPVAETLTGWRKIEALGRRMADVFQITKQRQVRLQPAPGAEVPESSTPKSTKERSSSPESPRAALEKEGMMLLSRDGIRRLVSHQTIPIPDGAGGLSGMALVFSEITEEGLAAEEMKARQSRVQRQQAAIVKLATHQSLVSGDFQRAAREITKTVAEAMNVERVSIWLLDEDGKKLLCQDLFERTARQHTAGMALVAEKYPAYFQALGSGRAIDAHDALNDPRTSEFASDYLRPLGIVAMLDAAIRVSGQLVGVVCHEHVGEPRVWLAEEITFAGEVADQAAHALQNSWRESAEKALWESEEKFSNLFQHSNDAIFLHNTDGRILDVNKKVTEKFGYSKDEILSLTIADLHPPGELESSAKAFEKLFSEGFVNFNITFKTKNGCTFPAEVSSSLFEIGGEKVVQGIVRDITDRKKAEDALQRKSVQQEKLIQTARYLTESLEVREVLTRVGTRAKEILEAYGCCIYLLSDDGTILTPVVAIEPSYEEEILSTPLDLEHSFTGKAILEKRGLIFNDATTGEGQQIPGTPEQQDERVIATPFVVDGEVLGAMCVNRLGTIFTEEDLILAETFATYAATALKNAQTYQELQREVGERRRTEEKLKESFDTVQRLLEQTVDVLASTVEMRDPYTAGHQNRVAVLACAIAAEMGLSKDQVLGLRLAALIHDIGKIYVPAEILSKPGSLTPSEVKLIQTHPQVGQNILKAVEFPWPVATIVLQHHERYDGSGYPQGLSGKEILVEARILRVADVIEAMSSHRPYRAARGITEALQILSERRGTYFDPQVVDTSLRLFYEKGFQFEGAEKEKLLAGSLNGIQ
jgi:PAS domain S-box-containing protein/putative nucleotidyltransferase with HDIG domain